MVIEINFNADMCMHTGECCRHLPDVFKVIGGQFFIVTTAGTEDEIAQTVKKCPSGALSIDKDY
ncbi:MAG: hypothetical protein COB23_02260 [Methylophaga sp.]|nr:MAG: hypothetical protein COB23_02260 [Methylophaga sp.]